MFDVGFSELLVFGIIALLVLGPDKLPEAARCAAKYYGKFKRVINTVQNDIDRELHLAEFREQMNNEMKRIQELEQKMQAQMDQLQQQKIRVEAATKTQQLILPKPQYYVLTAEPTPVLRAPLNNLASSQQLKCPLHQSIPEAKSYPSSATAQSSTQSSTLNAEPVSSSPNITDFKVAV